MILLSRGQIMKILFLALFLPYVFFKPDTIDETPYIKNDSKTIFKIKPQDPGGLKIQHVDKQVYSWIAEPKDHSGV